MLRAKLHRIRVTEANRDYVGSLTLDEDKSKPWDEKLFLRDETFDGKTIHVVGL